MEHRLARMTDQRKIILEELVRMRSHPTADELYAVVRRRLPSISLGTVYRNLEVMSEAGLIQKLEHAGSKKRYDGCTERHYHARCVSCGTVHDIEADTTLDLDRLSEAVPGFAVTDHRVELIGTCSRCTGTG